MAAGRAIHNHGTVIRNSQDIFGTSIFVKDERGRHLPELFDLSSRCGAIDGRA
jgi:hypothetical protein